MSAAAIGTLEAGEAFAETVLRACLADFPLVRMRVTGDCMRPALEPGDSVLIASAARSPPRFGDVVLVLTPDGPRLHRLVWRAPGSAWRRMGDRSPRWDAPLPAERVLGTLVAVEMTARPTRSIGRAIASLWRGWLARRRTG